MNAARFTQRGAGRTEAYRAVAYYVALTERRACYAAVATMAKRARLSLNTMRRQLQGLMEVGALEAVGGVSRGRKPTRYRLTLDVVQPSHEAPLNPPITGEEEGHHVPYVHTPDTSFRARLTCEKHGRSWFAADGPDCHECNLERARRPRERKATRPPARVRIGAPKSGPFEWTEADERALQTCKAAEIGGRRVTTSSEAAQRACTGIGAVG